MIKNKIVTITKTPQLKDTYNLFEKYSLNFPLDLVQNITPLEKIIKEITYANKINLILSDNVLPKKIVEEITWALKYLDFNVLVKNKKILDRYPILKEGKVKILNDLNINYLGIYGKNELHVLLEDYYPEVSDIYSKIYFLNEEVKENLNDFLKADTIYIFNNSSDDIYEELITKFLENHKVINYIIDIKAYNHQIYDKYFGKANLIVTNTNKNQVVAVKDNELFIPYYFKNQIIGKIIINNLFGYYDKAYIQNSNPNLKNKYFLINQEISLIDRLANKEINYSKTLDMGDFIQEKFNSKETLKVDEQYFATKKVTYKYELIPYRLDKTYTKSSLYNNIFKLTNELKKLNLPQEMLKKLISLEINNKSFIDDNEDFKDALDAFIQAVQGYNLDSYYDFLGKLSLNFNKLTSSLINNLNSIYQEVGSESKNNKLDKLDEEIAGYKKVIKEKEKELSEGKNLNQNNRRIEVLQEKIKNLETIKANFALKGTSELNIENKLQLIMNDALPVKSQESIAEVINKNLSRKQIFEKILEDYYKEYYQSLKDYEKLILKLEEEKIPVNYLCYDKDNLHYLVIDDLSEYEDYLNIKDEFNLKCIGR